MINFNKQVKAKQREFLIWESVETQIPAVLYISEKSHGENESEEKKKKGNWSTQKKKKRKNKLMHFAQALYQPHQLGDIVALHPAFKIAHEDILVRDDGRRHSGVHDSRWRGDSCFGVL